MSRDQRNRTATPRQQKRLTKLARSSVVSSSELQEFIGVPPSCAKRRASLGMAQPRRLCHTDRGESSQQVFKDDGGFRLVVPIFDDDRRVERESPFLAAAFMDGASAG